MIVLIKINHKYFLFRDQTPSFHFTPVHMTPLCGLGNIRDALTKQLDKVSTTNFDQSFIETAAQRSAHEAAVQRAALETVQKSSINQSLREMRSEQHNEEHAFKQKSKHKIHEKSMEGYQHNQKEELGRVSTDVLPSTVDYVRETLRQYEMSRTAKPTGMNAAVTICLCGWNNAYMLKSNQLQYIFTFNFLIFESSLSCPQV